MGKHVAVIGAGSWGTALSVVLAENGHVPYLWDLDKEHIAEMQQFRENRRYLPGIKLSDSTVICTEESEALKDADVVLFSVPAQHFASAFGLAHDQININTLIVNVAKGIDQRTLKTMSQIAYEIDPDIHYAVLSGPSHAEEVGRKMPTTVSVASKIHEDALAAQDLFINEFFRVYTNDDVAGLELGGALKNIIALGAGISDGLGFGDNVKAALMTRGIAEITRLGVRMGADPHTFSGLSGVGDLIVTCCSMHSRNRRCGILIGQGMSPEEAVKEVGMVVEGFYTTDAAYRLAQQLGVEMPITSAIYEIINGRLTADQAVNLLMGRNRRDEKEDVFR